ncbi:MAG: putative oxidoreductase [Candidatus Adlerbacteria bacterium]|nr:putative oxidoreductase [Candidatus Adlerbacteria bacterium]
MKIGIVGCGQMGGYYANNLVNKCGFPAADIVCYDIQPERSATLAQKYGITARDFFHEKLDAAIVATNTPSHEEVVINLAKFGVKHILCEKPLAQTSKSLENILRNKGQAHIYTALVINFSPMLLAFQDHRKIGGLELLDFYSRWGKNRGLISEKRPTVGDLEDEAVHVIGFMLALAPTCQSLSVNAQLGWKRYVDQEAQAAARKRDLSFPEQPNHSTSANFELFCRHDNIVLAHVHSSFLLPKETRTIGGVFGRDNEPEFAFECYFDQKRPDKTGGSVDSMIMVNIKTGESKEEEFSCDKLYEITNAFLTSARGGPRDSRLTSLNEAGALIKIAEAILESDSNRQKTIQVSLR